MAVGWKVVVEDEAIHIANHFAQNGIAVAAANYRLAPLAAYPDFIDDAAAAVAWVQAHIAQYGGNPRAMFVAGHSAGGYLAASVGIAPEYLAPYGVTLADIAGVIPISGQMFTHTAIRKARGITEPQATPVLDEAAPCYHVRKDAPPFTLAICADDDMPLRVEENRFFVAMLQYVGHPQVAYLQIADRDHGSVADKIPEPDDPVSIAILSFITKHARQ